MLAKYAVKKEFVKIYRKIFDIDNDLSGFILKITNKYLLIQIVDDFMFDGYAIIRLDDFDSIRSNSYDKTHKKVLKSEGTLDANHGLEININLNSWKDILSDLRKNDFHVIIESNKEDRLDFLIGPIKRISKDSVSIQYYDPTGKLEIKPTSIKMKDIRIIKFGDRYSSTFRKYLKPPTK